MKTEEKVRLWIEKASIRMMLPFLIIFARCFMGMGLNEEE